MFCCGSGRLLVWTGAGLVDDLGADFLYMDVGFFPVPKKAAPTKIFGFGFRLPKEMVIAFFASAGLLFGGTLLLLLPLLPHVGLAAALLNKTIVKG